MKLFLLAAMAASAAAFAPATTSVQQTALMAADTDMEIGAVAPLGFFDPLGYITDEEKFSRYRAVEKKHGRIAMMAMLGTFVHNNKWTFDGYLSPSQGLKFSDIDSGIGGLFQVPPAGLLQIILFCGFVELAWWPATQLDGDYGVRLGNINNWDEEPAKEIRQRNAELNNGRAAMMGILGTFVHEVVTGQNFAEQASSGHFSPFGDGQGFF
uniref:Plastid light harvesting protein n=2 Tax=Ditylum brightwellii TaxID=49249 RepID=A0A6S9GFP2_9STRA|mmetsp:Transcript_9640/g.12949  ORF Transcript_9640/g.12949 Transcript_9640/m.12949 type:complete len:211 (-) Transcript_9640:230-862(-)|eukprot:3019859-Ditylum_brightwellii.AAC.1